MALSWERTPRTRNTSARGQYASSAVAHFAYELSSCVARAGTKQPGASVNTSDTDAVKLTVSFLVKRRDLGGHTTYSKLSHTTIIRRYRRNANRFLRRRTDGRDFIDGISRYKNGLPENIASQKPTRPYSTDHHRNLKELPWRSLRNVRPYNRNRFPRVPHERRLRADEKPVSRFFPHTLRSRSDFGHRNVRKTRSARRRSTTWGGARITINGRSFTNSGLENR